MMDKGENEVVLPEPLRLDTDFESETGAVGIQPFGIEQSNSSANIEPLMEELKGDSCLKDNSSEPGSALAAEIKFPHDKWPYNNLIVQISKRLSKKELEYMKEMYKDEIDCDVLATIITPMQLFHKMEKIKCFSPVNLLQLEGLLWTLGRKDVLQLVIDYAHQTKNIVYLHPATDEPINGYKHVKFHVSGKDFTKMTYRELKYIRAVVASTLAMPEKFVLIDGVDPSGSVTVTLLLPNVYATVLQTLLDEDNTVIKMLIHVDIDRITIGGRVYAITDLDLGHDSDEVIQRQLNLFQKYNESKKRVASLEKENAKLESDLMVLRGKYDLLVGCKIPPDLAKLKKDVEQTVGGSKVSSDKKDIGKALEDFSETLKQISEAGFDKQLVLKLLQAHVTIIATRCYIELGSVIGHQSQEIKQILSGIMIQKGVLEVKRFMGDEADSEPAQIKALRGISKMLEPKEKEQLVKDYVLTKDDRKVIEDESVPFLLKLLQKEAQRRGGDENLTEFLKTCLKRIGRSDLLYVYNAEITKYEQEMQLMNAKSDGSKKSPTTEDVLYERKDREQMFHDLSKDMKLLMKDMENVKSAIRDLPKKSQFENVENMKTEHFKDFFETSIFKMYRG